MGPRARIPALNGKYLFADFGSGTIWGATEADRGADVKTLALLATGLKIDTFGEDESGELYVADYGTGTFSQLVPPPPPLADGGASDGGSDGGCP